MLFKRPARLWLLLLLIGVGARAEDRYTDAMYRQALAVRSTAPLYVLIKLQDPQTRRYEVACISAPFLLGAIHKEHGWDHDREGERRAMELALRQPGRAFRFSNKDARRNASPRYAPGVLDEHRRALAGFSNRELISQLRSGRSALHDLYESASDENYLAYRDAVAHVLLERGILVGRGDIPSLLYFADDRPRD